MFLKPAEEDTLEKMCRQSFGPSACKQGAVSAVQLSSVAAP